MKTNNNWVEGLYEKVVQFKRFDISHKDVLKIALMYYGDHIKNALSQKIFWKDYRKAKNIWLAKETKNESQGIAIFAQGENSYLVIGFDGMLRRVLLPDGKLFYTHASFEPINKYLIKMGYFNEK